MGFGTVVSPSFHLVNESSQVGGHLRKGGSVLGLPFPAIKHHLGRGASSSWRSQILAAAHKGYDLVVGIAGVRLLSVGEYLPQEDTIGPDIGGFRELAVFDTLRCHPTYWE